ncbi:MAG: flippase-like domain-containing protein [Candidatus Aureabacteria bacterium]|nr:flippase-like domain-containing protein [Candidatus Auribacterota bacterium]
MKRERARRAGVAARFAFAAAVIACILWRKIDPGELAVRLRGIDPRLFAACGLGYGLLFVFSAFRWQALVFVHGIRVRYGSLLRFCLIGAFFNNVMPGSMGGDILKAWYCAKVDRSRQEAAVGSVVADRIVGFLSLFAIGFFGLAVNLGAPGLRQASQIFVALFLAICLGLAFLSRRDLLAKLPFARRILDRGTLGDHLRRLYDSLQIYRARPRAVARALGISCLMQLVFIVVLLGIARSLGMRGVAYRHLLLLMPLIGTIAAVPVTPSGWGTMEWAFVYFFPALGVTAEQALALDLATRALTISWGLVGGVLYAVPPRQTAGCTASLN